VDLNLRQNIPRSNGKNWTLVVNSKITTLFSRTRSNNSCVKCIPTIHESLGSILKTPIFCTLRIDSSFIWCPIKAQEENIKYSFEFQ